MTFTIEAKYKAGKWYKLAETIKETYMNAQYDRYDDKRRYGFFVLGMPKISQDDRAALNQFNIREKLHEKYDAERDV